MKGKIFYEKRNLRKYRTIFETAEIIVGADRKNKYRTFRKDTGAIAFSRREILEMRLHDLTNKPNAEAETNENKQFNRFNNSALGLNFG